MMQAVTGTTSRAKAKSASKKASGTTAAGSTVSKKKVKNVA
jgi:hypothetical protein